MAIKRSLIWPPPVYVAKFSDGTECRMSCGDYRKGKAATGYDFNKGRRVACNVVGAERARARYIGARGSWHPDNVRRIEQASGPATDIIGGHFDHDGQIILDPYFVEPERGPMKQKATTLEKLIASIRKLSADDLLRLTDEIEMAFETAE